MWFLSEAAKLYPQGDFFFSAEGKKHNRIYNTLRAACKALNISYGANVANGFVIHDARHTFVTVLEHGGIDSSTTRSFSGHSKDTMLKRYAHATIDSRSRAIEREIGVITNCIEDNETRLRRIYKQVKNGKLTFPQFKKSLEDSMSVF